MRADVSFSLDDGDWKKSGKVETTHWSGRIIPPFTLHRSLPFFERVDFSINATQTEWCARDASAVLLNWLWSIRIERADFWNVHHDSMPPIFAPDIWIKAVLTRFFSLTNCLPLSVAAPQDAARNQPHQNWGRQGRQDCVSRLHICFLSLSLSLPCFFPVSFPSGN